MGPTLVKHKDCLIRTSQSVSQLCLRIIRDIKAYLEISISIEILETLTTGLLQLKSLMAFLFILFAAFYTR